MNKERRTFHKTEQKEKKTYICFRHMKSSRALKKKKEEKSERRCYLRTTL